MKEIKVEPQTLFEMEFKEMEEIQFIQDPKVLNPHQLKWVDGVAISLSGLSACWYHVKSREDGLIHMRHYTEMRSVER